MARRAAPNEDRTRVTLTWVFSRSDLATVSGATGSIPSLFTQGLVLPRTPLYWKHTKRAGVHSISGGMYTLPPYGSIRSFLGECVMYPPDFACACTLCMHVFCKNRGVFRGLLAGVFGDCPPDPARYQYFSRSVPCGRRGSGLI